MGNKTLADHSRTNWAPATPDSRYPGDENIKLGCLQRIADAVEKTAVASEKMASNYVSMERNLKYYRDRCKSLQDEVGHLQRSRAAHQAHATRLRNKLAEVESNDRA